MQTMDFFPGQTPKQALLRACNRATATNDIVTATIDGVVMIITKDTNVMDAFFEYRKKLDNMKNRYTSQETVKTR